MDTPPNSFIKIDNNTILNIKYIRWVKKMDECLEICSKMDGCSNYKKHKDTHTLCKINNADSYNEFIKFFKE